MRQQNATVILVPARIPRLQPRHLQRPAEAVGRGPGNRRGVPN